MILVIVLLLTGQMGCALRPSRVYKISQPNSQRNEQILFPNQAQGPNNREYLSPSDKFSFTSGRAELPSTESQRNPLPVYLGTDTYHVGVGDILKVTIFQLMDLEKDSVLLLEVDHNGQINLPLLNYVKVAGLTIDQIRDELIYLLSRDYIRNPKVDVSINSYRSKQVMILGFINRSGSMALETDSSTLLDVISQAGGITSGAALEIEILRGAYDPSGTLGLDRNGLAYPREVVPISKLFGEEGQEQVNPPIFAGDIIKVRPANDGYIYFAGEVNSRGSKAFRRPLTILQALACAGGTTNIAAEEKCKIIRRDSDGSEKEIIIDLKKIREGNQPNLLMARNDTIIVPVDPVKKFFDDLDKLISRGVRTGVSATYNANEDLGLPANTYGGY